MVSCGFFFENIRLVGYRQWGRRKRQEKFLVPGRREMDKYVLGQCHFGQSLS
jgi:hypothetical protein